MIQKQKCKSVRHNTSSITFVNRRITAIQWSTPRTANPVVSSIFVVFEQMRWMLPCFIFLSCWLAPPYRCHQLFRITTGQIWKPNPEKFRIWFVVGFAVLPFLSALSSLCVQSPFTVCPLIIASSTLHPHHCQLLIIATTSASSLPYTLINCNHNCHHVPSNRYH